MFNGRLVAAREGLAANDTMNYYLTDVLGSVTTTLYADGSVKAQKRYKPFGEERYTDNITPTGQRFTGQRWDDGLGLYDYNARYYDQTLGRFVGTDTIVQDPSIPQSFNRYSYVNNNPVAFTDPTGHLTEKEMQDYFNFADESEAIAALGEELAGLLWNTSVTWGDVIEYSGGSAMITLFEVNTSINGQDHYRGGFWGVGGDKAGREISKNELANSDKITLNGDLAEKFRSGEKSLFVSNDSPYDYTTDLFRIGADELGILLAVLGVGAYLAGVALFGVAFLSGGAAIPAELAGVATVLTLLGTGATVFGFLTMLFGDSPRHYPVIRFNNPVGNKNTISLTISAP